MLYLLNTVTGTLIPEDQVISVTFPQNGAGTFNYVIYYSNGFQNNAQTYTSTATFASQALAVDAFNRLVTVHALT